MKKLECAVQNYAWGKKGLESTVGVLFQSLNSGKEIDTSKTYAELWMGTHPSAPSKMNNENILLSDFLKINVKEYFSSNEVVEFFEKQGYDHASLPFLFKVLSVNQALSIQAHPNQHLAKQLFNNDPEHYKDPYHKPELCYALTDFEALCAFQTIENVISNIKSVEELQSLLRVNNNEFVESIITKSEQDIRNMSKEDKRATLKELFKLLMTSHKSQVDTFLPVLVRKLQQKENASPVEKLLLRLYSDYGNDIGCFSVYFMNYITLKPGEALFLGPNEPHSYLSGDCVECMASSDNVVRAGLTPKFIDTNTLVEMLTYDDEALEKMKLVPQKINEFETLYVPPVSEFKVHKISLINQHDIYKWSTSGISIAIVMEGVGSVDGVTVKKGDVFLFPCNATAQWSNDGCSAFEVFISSTNL